jgi:hypothetical protein
MQQQVRRLLKSERIPAANINTSPYFRAPTSRNAFSAPFQMFRSFT